jgi:hypothetical protein
MGPVSAAVLRSASPEIGLRPAKNKEWPTVARLCLNIQSKKSFFHFASGSTWRTFLTAYICIQILLDTNLGHFWSSWVVSPRRRKLGDHVSLKYSLFLCCCLLFSSMHHIFSFLNIIIYKIKSWQWFNFPFSWNSQCKLRNRKENTRLQYVLFLVWPIAGRYTVNLICDYQLIFFSI